MKVVTYVDLYKAWLALYQSVAQVTTTLGPVYETNFLVRHYFRCLNMFITDLNSCADWSSIN